MQKIYLSRLYFKKYPYKISFIRRGTANSVDWTTGWTPISCEKWLKQQNINYRVYKKVSVRRKGNQVTVRMNLFVPTRQDYNRCIKKWNKWIELITEPYMESHIDILKNNIHVIIREKLIYEKYRYVIVFRRSWNQNIDDINLWIRSNFLTASDSNKTSKWVRYGYNPRLYLSKEEDLVLVKLFWGERIRQITIIQPLDEIVN